MSKKKLHSIESNVIICFIFTLYHDPTLQSLLPSALKLQNHKQISYECVFSVCVEIWHLFHVCDIKYGIKINFFMYNLGLFSYYICYIFLNERAEPSSISLECINVKISMLNNFGSNNRKERTQGDHKINH